MSYSLQCGACDNRYSPDEVGYQCDCGGLLDVFIPLEESADSISLKLFDERWKKEIPGRSSGVWRYKELVLPGIDNAGIVTMHEGNTRLYDVPRLAGSLGLDSLQIKHEGENPSGSFKDRGMTVAISRAKQQGARIVACASTGNTSASVALYAARAEMTALVLIPRGKISQGKLAQALAFSAVTVEVEGDFDDCMRLIIEGAKNNILYPMNSVNPFRLAGQKTIIWELLQQNGWDLPDWIVFPAGNLGNYSAFGRAIHEFYQMGLIKKKPRLAGIQAAGANPFYRSYLKKFQKRYTVKAETIASAIRIGNPVNYPRAVRAVEWTDGIVSQADDKEIMDAKSLVEGLGIGAEPSSCTAIAGLKRLIKEDSIKSDESVVVIFTGHMLKDTESIISYHTNSLNGPAPGSQGRILTLKPTLRGLEKLINSV